MTRNHKAVNGRLKARRWVSWTALQFPDIVDSSLWSVSNNLSLEHWILHIGLQWTQPPEPWPKEIWSQRQTSTILSTDSQVGYRGHFVSYNTAIEEKKKINCNGKQLQDVFSYILGEDLNGMEHQNTLPREITAVAKWNSTVNSLESII